MRSDNSSVSFDFIDSTIGIDMQSQVQGSFMDRLQAGVDIAGSVMEAGQDIVDGLAESYAQEHDFNKGDRGF